MKRILIITTEKRLAFSFAFCITIVMVAAFILITAKMYFSKYSQVFDNSEISDISKLLKENSMLNGLFYSIIPEDNKVILEDEYRNIYKNIGATPPLPLAVSPLSEVISQGIATKFRILSDDPEYLRPIYDPVWKGAFFRSWLYLPYKNIEARHRIFAFSIGGSENYDITGSLGFKPKSSPKAPMDNHRNINFLIYNFNVTGIKVLQNQVALIGAPTRTGARIVSIIQNDLLPDGIDTKDFLFQLSTPEGYEVDFLYHNIIRYEYLMEQIKEHTVQPAFSDNKKYMPLEKLLEENAALKQELTYFIPYEDEEIITQQACDDLFKINNELPDINYVIQHGVELPFYINYRNALYKRPLYDPLWKINYKRMWCYIPKQIEFSLHRLHIIPQSLEEQYDFFGASGFHEKHKPIEFNQYGFMIYNFDILKAITYKNQLLFIGVPSRTGAEIIVINRCESLDLKDYHVKLVTPDNLEFDCCNVF